MDADCIYQCQTEMSNSRIDEDAKSKGTTTQYLKQLYTLYYNNID